MEDIHGVDVSWLHHSTREHHHRQHAPSSPGLSRDAPPRTSAHGGLPYEHAHEERKPTPPINIAPKPAPLTSPSPASTTPPAPKSPGKRPNLLGRQSSERIANGTGDPKMSSRRNSWISSISSKFSSTQNSPAQTTHAQAQGSPATPHAVNGTQPSANGALNGIHGMHPSAAGGSPGQEPYTPQHPKGTSFISNALRRLSSGTQVGTAMHKANGQGGLCPRRVLNVDPNRNRCLVPELDENKLRRVAFCVDVEIAGGPRYKEDANTEEQKKKRKDKKLKDRAEGEALKHPDALAQEKEQNGTVSVPDASGIAKEVVGNDETANPEGSMPEEDKKESSKKKEKKKRTEAERKERKEKKRRKAEENGSVPLEIMRDDDDESADNSPPNSLLSPVTPIPRPQDRPTVDPIRIYRRCCQLRETPILKRISDQLCAPSACPVASPGVVTCLDLTGSRLQFADVVTLSDWLAIVPVKKLFLEDADLNNEKIRVILAGLLAAKVPEPTKRRPVTSENGNGSIKTSSLKTEERAGVVKKLVLKNNPKITAEGWRHISLFLYLCKSIEAVDVSMIPFPKSAQLSPQTSNSTHGASGMSGSSAPNAPPSKDIADTLSKAISERLGGSKLEELVMAECSLTAPAIRKIIDGVIVSGVQRLGLAGNDIDSEGLDHVIHYIRSGVCQGIDLGGNDLRDGIARLARSFSKDCPLWLLSVADCDLDPESLRTLFPALVNLPNFRFLDLSHNKKLFSNESSLCLLRKYLPQLKGLKRIHLIDVSMKPAEAIGLAEVLPECEHIAHISILENTQISAVVAATDEESQEEAVALYASLMAAARVSHTIICIDVDVPPAESGEVVKALAKQVVAFCLRNMENFTEIPELKGPPKDVEVPDVLRHLTGPTDVDHIDEDQAPDNDYIVGGTGVVKALSYCLLQRASDLRRQSLPISGVVTPKTQAEEVEDITRAKTMSKNLLESARQIRTRLQPALVREARIGDDMAYRRLLFLDQTLRGMIQRFEDEYPDTKIQHVETASITTSSPSTSPPPTNALTFSTTFGDTVGIESDDEDTAPRPLRSRHNSDVSLASRNLSLEEGRLHRLGHRIRTEIMNASRPPSTTHSEDTHDVANVSGTMDDQGLPEHILALREKFFNVPGEDIRDATETVGLEKAFEQVMNNAEELRILKEENPEEFKKFRESQLMALRNSSPEQFTKEVASRQREVEELKEKVHVGHGGEEKGPVAVKVSEKKGGNDDFAIED